MSNNYKDSYEFLGKAIQILEDSYKRGEMSYEETRRAILSAKKNYKNRVFEKTLERDKRNKDVTICID